MEFSKGIIFKRFSAEICNCSSLLKISELSTWQIASQSIAELFFGPNSRICPYMKVRRIWGDSAEK